MFYYALLLLFIAYRLANIIQWSWWLVMIPAYMIIFIQIFARKTKDKKEEEIEKLRQLLDKIKEARR